MNRVMRWTVLALVAASMVSASTARGDLTYDYSFGTAASGTFTTGAASSQDPGYFLVTSLTVTSFTDQGGRSIPVSISAGSGSFAADAAFDPSTNDFINHSGGQTTNDLGVISVPSGTIDGNLGVVTDEFSFAQNSTLLHIETSAQGGLDFTAIGSLTITPETASVPEPSTAIVAVFGAVAFLAYGWSRHRRAMPRPGNKAAPTDAGQRRKDQEQLLGEDRAAKPSVRQSWKREIQRLEPHAMD